MDASTDVMRVKLAWGREFGVDLKTGDIVRDNGRDARQPANRRLQPTAASAIMSRRG
jgi:hypothetical protein